MTAQAQQVHQIQMQEMDRLNHRFIVFSDFRVYVDFVKMTNVDDRPHFK